MALNLQASFLNVGEIERSIEFYESIFKFEVLAREPQAAVLLITKEPLVQALVLREVGRHPHHSGGATIGPSVLSFEAASRAEFEEIKGRFVERDPMTGHRQAADWEVLFGHDPDRIQIVLSVGMDGAPISAEGWSKFDSIVYMLGS